MIVVNLFGSPGSGKSTSAAYVFSKLKMLNYNCELVTEFAKDATWENNQTALSNQFYVFGQQSYRLSRLKEQVDIVITDSPLFLSVIYANPAIDKDAFSKLIMDECGNYTNINFLIARTKKYNPCGRNQTEEEANQLGIKIKRALDEYNIPFEAVKGDYDGYEYIFNNLKARLEGE